MCYLAGNLKLTVSMPPDNAAPLAVPSGADASTFNGNSMGTGADDLAPARLRQCWRVSGIDDFLMWCLLSEGVGGMAVGHHGDRTCELAAPMLLVTKAGGCVTDPAAQPWSEGQLAVASSRDPPRRNRG